MKPLKSPRPEPTSVEDSAYGSPARRIPRARFQDPFRPSNDNSIAEDVLRKTLSRPGDVPDNQEGNRPPGFNRNHEQREPFRSYAARNPPSSAPAFLKDAPSIDALPGLSSFIGGGSRKTSGTSDRTFRAALFIAFFVLAVLLFDQSFGRRQRSPLDANSLGGATDKHSEIEQVVASVLADMKGSSPPTGEAPTSSAASSSGSGPLILEGGERSSSVIRPQWLAAALRGAPDLSSLLRDSDSDPDSVSRLRAGLPLPLADWSDSDLLGAAREQQRIGAIVGLSSGGTSAGRRSDLESGGGQKDSAALHHAQPAQEKQQRPLITIFTVPSPFSEPLKDGDPQVQALRSWLRLLPAPRIVLLGSHPSLERVAALHPPGRVTVDGQVETTFGGNIQFHSVVDLALRADTKFSAIVGSTQVLLSDVVVAAEKADGRFEKPWLIISNSWEVTGRGGGGRGIPVARLRTLDPGDSAAGPSFLGRGSLLSSEKQRALFQMHEQVPQGESSKRGGGDEEWEVEVFRQVRARGMLKSKGGMDFWMWNNVRVEEGGDRAMAAAAAAGGGERSPAGVGDSPQSSRKHGSRHGFWPSFLPWASSKQTARSSGDKPRLLPLPLASPPMPPFIVGQGRYDNWLTHHAIESGLREVLDATEAVTVVDVRKEAVNGTWRRVLSLPDADGILPKLDGWQKPANEHLASSHGNYSNQRGTALHAPWKLTICAESAAIGPCLVRRRRPRACPCEYSSFVRESSTDVAPDEKHRVLGCGQAGRNLSQLPGLSNSSSSASASSGALLSAPSPALWAAPFHSLDQLLPHAFTEVQGSTKGQKGYVYTRGQVSKTVVLVVAGAGEEALLMNFVCAWRALAARKSSSSSSMESRRNVLVAATDAQILEFAFTQGLPVFMAGSPASPPVSACSDSESGMEEGCRRKQKQAAGLNTVLSVLTRGYSVLLCDLTTVWREDPLPALVALDPRSLAVPQLPKPVARPAALLSFFWSLRFGRRGLAAAARAGGAAASSSVPGAAATTTGGAAAPRFPPGSEFLFAHSSLGAIEAVKDLLKGAAKAAAGAGGAELPLFSQLCPPRGSYFREDAHCLLASRMNVWGVARLSFSQSKKHGRSGAQARDGGSSSSTVILDYWRPSIWEAEAEIGGIRRESLAGGTERLGYELSEQSAREMEQEGLWVYEQSTRTCRLVS